MAEWAHVNHDSPEWPAWGTLALDAFMLENWSSESDDPEQNAEQRVQLVRKFREIGERERAKYKQQAEHGNAQPTEAQITNILTHYDRLLCAMSLGSWKMHLISFGSKPIMHPLFHAKTSFVQLMMLRR